MIIDEKGNVGVGTLENVGAKLDVDGDSRFRGPLTVDQKPESGPSLTVLGAAKIGEVPIQGSDLLTVGGDAKVDGTMNIGRDAVVTGKVQAGGLQVGPLAVSDKVGIGVSEVGPDVILDVGSRMRVRQGQSVSAGIWFSQREGGDKAFVGMRDDNRVGFFGAGLEDWGLAMDTNSGSIVFFTEVDETFIGRQHEGLRVNIRARTFRGVPGIPTSHPMFTFIDRTPLLVHSRGVGINTAEPGFFALDVAGSAHATSFPTSSDGRLKTKATQLNGVLEKLRNVRGVSFEWNELYASMGRSTGKREIGVIAQEIEAVFPELVTEWGKENYKALDYGRLSAVLLEAVKELAADTETLTKRVRALETRNGEYPR